MEQNKIKKWKWPFKYNNNFNIYAKQMCALYTPESKEGMASIAMFIITERRPKTNKPKEKNKESLQQQDL